MAWSRKEFCERLRLAREDLGWTQGDLAKECGYRVETGQVNISRWESPEANRIPPLSDIETLARALKKSPGWLAFGDQPLKDDEETLLRAYRLSSTPIRKLLYQSAEIALQALRNHSKTSGKSE